MGKPKKPIYVYQDGDFLIKCESVCSASRLTKESLGCVNDIIKKPRWSKKGFFYSFKQLRPDELPDYTETPVKVIPREFEDYADEESEFYIPRKKEKAKSDLRQFFYAHMTEHWKKVPAYVARMERSYLEDLLRAI